MVKSTIKRKLVFIMIFSIAIITLVSAILVYFAGSIILMDVLGKEYSQIARTLNVYTVKILTDEIEDAHSYTTNVTWVNKIIERNLRYKGMDAGSIKQQLLDMDSKWVTADPGSPLLAEYLDNKVSDDMKEILKVRPSVSELFITDRYGGLVAASNKTSDFYQADEEWWQRAFNGGKGGVYAGDVEFDESSKDWVISIAVPIRDLKGEVIGICKDSIGIEKLFKNFAGFKLGDTGHAILIDNKGTAIFHHGISTTINNMLPQEMLNKILAAKNPYMMIRSGLLHDRDTFVAFSEVKPPHVSDRGVSWIVLIVQDMSEVYAPIRHFIIQIAIIAILIILLAIPIGSFFGKLIADPIHKLHLATEKVMAGDLDYKIDVNTGDEIEQFAETFRDMIADIKNKQKALQNFSDGLEVKVEERTKELEAAQEAALNILEDLQASKEALERTNRELVKIDELKSEFISTVSHELRTPLSIIKEGISLVLDKIPGEINEKQSKILDISKYNIDRLARIIDDLLDISKIESGKVELRRNLIDISDIVRQVADSFESKVKENGLVMRLDIDNVVGSVWADTDRITQVLTNLIGNAVKFTPSGYIDISCKDKGDVVSCSVSDTGVGILKEDMPKVFNKFQQFGRTAGAGEKGTGLGLSIVKNIIELHNGNIWVESEPGKGTRFTFKLRKYTSQSLFREYVSKAIKRTASEGGSMSVIAIGSSLIGKDVVGVINNKFNDIMHESTRLIKGTLKHEGDDVISIGGDMIIILTDCDREGAARVQYRLENIVGKYLADQKTEGAIKVNYGYATYPDDAKGDLELIEKARSALAVSTKA